MEARQQPVTDSTGQVERLTALYQIGLQAQKLNDLDSLGANVTPLVLEGLMDAGTVSIVLEVGEDSYSAGLANPTGSPTSTDNIMIEGQGHGCLAVWHAGHRFSPEEVTFLKAVAEIVSLWWERVRAVTAAEHSMALLEEKVAERTAELSRSNAELEAFTYTVSHDLRAPLRALQGFARILEEDYAPALDDYGHHVIQVLIDSAHGMAHLIDDLLELSRVGRKNLSFFSLDMDTLVDDCIEALEPTQPEIRTIVHVDRLGTALGDPTTVRQVWMNLLDNALKFTSQESSPQIHVGTLDDGEQATFYISDNGVGFDMRYVNKLFVTFERLHPATEFKGTGVGLAIVKRIIEMHNGKIWAEGIPGKGASFFFTLMEHKGDSDE